MATIYRFVIEQKQTQTSGRKGGSSGGSGKGTTAKKGKMVSIFAGEKGGVEHNRKMRAINPLLNKATHGYWEKSMRLGRAGAGLVQRNTETGKLGLSGPAIAIIIAFIIQTLLKWQNIERQKAMKFNRQNYKAMENGFGAVHGEYETNVNFWTGRTTYNENK